MAGPKITIMSAGTAMFQNYYESNHTSHQDFYYTQYYNSTLSGTAHDSGRIVYTAFNEAYRTSYATGSPVTQRSQDCPVSIKFASDGVTPLNVSQLGDLYASRGVFTFAEEDWYLYKVYRATIAIYSPSAGHPNPTSPQYVDFVIRVTPVYEATLDNTEGFATATLTLDGTTYSVAAGATKTVECDPNKTASFAVSSTDNNQGHFLGWEKDGSTVSTSSSYSTLVSASITVKALWTPKYAVSIVAPSNSSIDYVFGLDGSAIDDASGTVAAGQSVTVRVYNTSVNGKMTLVLSIPDANYSTDTFQGWTKDGTVIDRWSNPATIVASEAATYSCAIGSAPSPSPDAGMLLYDRYGNLLYAGDPSTVTHTISVTATFAVTQHWIDYDIAGTSGDVEVTGTTFSKSVSFSDSRFGNSTGELLYADKVLAAKPFLTKVFFHCQVPEHMYSVVIKLDGTQIYSEDYLSGTFSKTFEI